MSFMLVVMFFAVFGLIVLTEIFLIDERRGVSVGGTGVLGGHRSGHRLPAAPDRPDYGEVGVSTAATPAVASAIYITTSQLILHSPARDVTLIVLPLSSLGN